jgi:hypothetical protein
MRAQMRARHAWLVLSIPRLEWSSKNKAETKYAPNDYHASQHLVVTQITFASEVRFFMFRFRK